LERFYDLDDQMEAAYKANDFAKATTLANEYLGLAAAFPKDWNYGNAIHDGNRMLGLIALKAGNTDAAISYLLKSGKTPGSPQLDSFGPDLELANALLKVGKVDAVKTYLKDIKSFWEMDDGRINAWLTAINKGERPELSRIGLGPDDNIKILIATIAALVWPILATMVFLFFRHKHIAMKPLFFLTGAVSAYVTMFLGGWGATSGIDLVVPHMINAGVAQFFFILIWLEIAAVVLLPVLAIFVVSRFFRPKLATTP
jgi:hypothetical protein